MLLVMAVPASGMTVPGEIATSTVWGWAAPCVAALTALKALTLPWPNHRLKPAALKLPGSLTGVSVTKDMSLSAVWRSSLATCTAVNEGLADNTRPHTPATVGVALEVPPNRLVKREPGVKSDPAPAPSLSVVTTPRPGGLVWPRSSQLSEGAQTLICWPHDE